MRSTLRNLGQENETRPRLLPSVGHQRWDSPFNQRCLPRSTRGGGEERRKEKHEESCERTARSSHLLSTLSLSLFLFLFLFLSSRHLYLPPLQARLPPPSSSSTAGLPRGAPSTPSSRGCSERVAACSPTTSGGTATAPRRDAPTRARATSRGSPSTSRACSTQYFVGTAAAAAAARSLRCAT